MQSSLPCRATREPSDMSRLDPSSSPWFAFGCCSHSPASLPGYHKNHMIWLDLILIDPLAFIQFTIWVPPEHSFNDKFCLVYVCCAFIIYFELCFVNYCTNILITAFLNLEMYSRYLDPKNNPWRTTTLHVFSINSKKLTICAYFHLRVGFSKVYYRNSRKQDIWNQFLQLGWGGLGKCHPNRPVGNRDSWYPKHYRLADLQTWR
jgi:hypothetical protein